MILDTVPKSEYPNCLQTMTASGGWNLSSQTVPHTLSIQTSTRPSLGFDPLTSLVSPSLHTDVLVAEPIENEGIKI